MTRPAEDDLFAFPEGQPYLLVETRNAEIDAMVREIAERTDRHVDIPKNRSAATQFQVGRVAGDMLSQRPPKAPYAFLIAGGSPDVGTVISMARSFGRLAAREGSIAVVLPAEIGAGRGALQRSIDHGNEAFTDPDATAEERRAETEQPKDSGYVRMEDLVVINSAEGDVRGQLEKWMASLPAENEL